MEWELRNKMESLTWTIQEFFDRVNKGEKHFSDLIDDFREYQRAQKMNAYRDLLPDDVDVLKSNLVSINFNRDS